MEMHIVHRKQEYGSAQKALGYSDGLSVLAFFFQVSIAVIGPTSRFINCTGRRILIYGAVNIAKYVSMIIVITIM
jgi:hypothetical protein